MYDSASLAGDLKFFAAVVGNAINSFMGRSLPEGSQSTAPLRNKALLCDSPPRLKTTVSLCSETNALLLTLRHGFPNICPAHTYAVALSVEINVLYSVAAVVMWA